MADGVSRGAAGGTAPPTAIADPGAVATEERWLVGLIVVAIAVRLATLGLYPLMDNTEARYAEVARQMVVTGDWITLHHRAGEAFWSKPPLSTWLTAISFTLFGVNEFAARLASLVPSLGVAWLVYDLARRRGRGATALRATAVLLTTPIFFVAAGGVMTDAALVLGTTLSMAGFWHAMTRSDGRGRVWGYLFFVGLAIGLLAKGPVGVVLTLVPVGIWTVWKGGIGNVWRRVPWITGTLLTAALAVPWYVLAEMRTPGFLDYFIVGEHWNRYLVSGWKGDRFGTAHARPRGTIWLFLIATTLPWCAAWLALAIRKRRIAGPVTAANDGGWRAYLWLWLLASPVFFTPAGNILATYVLPGMPAFALLVAEAWTALDKAGGARASTKYCGVVMPVLMVVAVLFALPRIAPNYTHKGLVAEYLAHRTSDAQKLVYVGEPPLSAEFYAAGRIAMVATTDELEGLLQREPQDWVVISDADLAGAPALHDRLVAIARSSRWQLMHAGAAASAH
jgi:4-amino-4-deoxy-L-arabinose transferase-like glycosyltransferase